MLSHRRFCREVFARRIVLIFSIALAMTAEAATDDFPKKTITILCHSSPGSPVDVMARQIADSTSKILGVPMVVETRTGGSGAVAMAHLLNQPADGQTVYAMTRSNADLFASGEIKDFAWKDLTYIIRVQVDPFILAANPNAPYKNAKDMLAFAKKNPGKVQMAGFGTGSAHHVAALNFARAAGIKITWVPYAGGAEATTNVLGGHVPVVHTNPGIIIKHVQAGKLVALATSSGKRLPSLPETPTYKELGANFEDYHWRGIAAKRGVPEQRIRVLHDAFRKAMETPSFKEYTSKSNLLPGYMNTADFTKLFGDTVDETTAVLKEMGLK
ncbi:MAG: tripartite tricarboxylate transporter substrate binding protein [Deltaproteobacteria bacterium]|nr:tripartite tricarboxylate transporter substrate binding protein [Deltaproteobacteria bacterium]